MLREAGDGAWLPGHSLAAALPSQHDGWPWVASDTSLHLGTPFSSYSYSSAPCSAPVWIPLGCSIFWDIGEKSPVIQRHKTSPIISMGQGGNVFMLNTLLPPRAKKEKKKEDEEMHAVDQKEPPLAKLVPKACHWHQ